MFLLVPWQAFPPQFSDSGSDHEPTQDWCTFKVLHSARLRLTCKHWNRLERLARDKQSSLQQTFVNYSYKKFYDIGPTGPNVIKLYIDVIYEFF